MKIIRILTLFFLFPPLAAQDVTTFLEPSGQFVSQSFAFDRNHDFFAVINQVDNEILLIYRKGNGRTEIAHRFPVDNSKGKRDEQQIYRPTSVAIYDGYVAFLASNSDSCYFAALNPNGELATKLTFPGYANAFSYHQQENELYITGENANGFNLIVLDTRNGVNRVDMKDVSILHYQRTRTSEEIAGRNRRSIGMMIIIICVAIPALLMLYLRFKLAGTRLIPMQARRKYKTGEKEVDPNASTVAVSDGVYAAIATAIYLYGEELHDVENTVLTINKVSRTYSPWSSKIHGLNTYFKR